MKNNVIRVGNGGIGIILYGTSSNLPLENLVLADNIIYPSSAAASNTAVVLDTYANATIQNNIFQGSGIGNDLYMYSSYDAFLLLNGNPSPFQLNTWCDNVNFSGTQFNIGGAPPWEPGEEDRIVFTPTNGSGWYRIIQGDSSVAGTIGLVSGAWENALTDLEFWYRVTGYSISTNTVGQIVESRSGNYPYPISYQVTQARICDDGSANIGVDIYVNINSGITPTPITVTSKGLLREPLLNPPQYNPTLYTWAVTNDLW